ncbi:MAG: hypothetical protein LBM77_02250 [Spirochaetaceae bacterium]|nr:hypothetical protein [Spirochaetaceae bacterium]
MTEKCKPYVEIQVVDKLALLKEHNQDMLPLFNETVECIHCGKKFILNEFKVVKDNVPCDIGDEYIVCKYFPECNGSLIDFFPAKE